MTHRTRTRILLLALLLPLGGCIGTARFLADALSIGRTDFGPVHYISAHAGAGYHCHPRGLRR